MNKFATLGVKKPLHSFQFASQTSFLKICGDVFLSVFGDSCVRDDIHQTQKKHSVQIRGQSFSSILPVSTLNTALRRRILRRRLVGPDRSKRKATRLKTMPIKHSEMMLLMMTAIRSDTQSTNTATETPNPCRKLKTKK